MRASWLAAGLGIVALIAAAAAWGGTIVGTPSGDVLTGSPRNDRI